jgi:DNA-binding response OmpR family regulator
MVPLNRGWATSRTPGFPRVLLVEDDCRSHDLLRKILVHAGCNVISAMTQADGLAWIERCHGLDCAILDLRLPDGDGETILRRLRSERSVVRVAVTTAEEDPQRLARLAELRPNLFLRKPIDLPVLLDWLDLPANVPHGRTRPAVLLT